MTTKAAWVLALAASSVALGCDKGERGDRTCEDSPSEQACRQCCQAAGAPGATWVDSECACLRAP
jgi:hypothetical protein